MLTQKIPTTFKNSMKPAGNLARVPYRMVRQITSYFQLRRPSQPLKLHLGCGYRAFPGFINIDMNWTSATDYTCNIAKLPCPDGSVERIETYHVIEHIPRPQVEQVLREWHRVLMPDGVLVMECPDFARNIEELLHGNETSMYSIFGKQRFPGDAHHWGYTKSTLSELVKQVGFSRVVAPPAQDYHAEREPCIRVEAIK